LNPAPPLIVKVIKGEAREGEKRFTEDFLIGRHSDSDLQIQDSRVSRVHARIFFEGNRWRVKDMESANGTYLEGVRVQEALLPPSAELELGKGGPVVSLAWEVVETPKIEIEKETRPPSATQIMEHYFGKRPSEKIGEHTLMFRRAFERAHRKRSRKYWVSIGVALLLLIAAGGMILHQKNKLERLQGTAVNMFYSIKSLELQVTQMEEVLLTKAEPHQVRSLLAKREQLKVMEKEYDHFVGELGFYKKVREEDRIILRMARLFGECDVNIPQGFVKEVWNYIHKWQRTDRLRKAIQKATIEGYTPKIKKMMMEYNLPPHFFFLALQESNFEAHAVGPLTRFGYAKGIWQFIPLTAQQYGLKIGPLYREGRYDPKDERFHFEKATEAAAKYIREIKNNLAQASGLLVMASYNWNETRIREILRQMPENPRERNFWQLLKKENIPQETYDYVFYIFSAAVICQNPSLFGFDFDSPILTT
jgi:pSer/pThr/pTyr-binding forkhead associated (FHA) protein